MVSSCPHCSSKKIKKLETTTQLGYARFYCSSCYKKFNERTNPPFNLLKVPTDIMFMVIRWRFLYKLSLRDLSDMFLERGFQFSHETIRLWERKFAPLIIDQLRKKRRGKCGSSWHVDETYVKVAGNWHYLYRAIDKDGNLVECRLSEKRDFEAAEDFFKSALDISEIPPEKVTTDGHKSYPRSIEEVLGTDVEHRTNQYLNNLIEQNHREKFFLPHLVSRSLSVAGSGVSGVVCALGSLHLPHFSHLVLPLLCYSQLEVVPLRDYILTLLLLSNPR